MARAVRAVVFDVKLDAPGLRTLLLVVHEDDGGEAAFVLGRLGAPLVGAVLLCDEPTGALDSTTGRPYYAEALPAVVERWQGCCVSAHDASELVSW